MFDRNKNGGFPRRYTPQDAESQSEMPERPRRTAHFYQDEQETNDAASLNCCGTIKEQPQVEYVDEVKFENPRKASPDILTTRVNLEDDIEPVLIPRRTLMFYMHWQIAQIIILTFASLKFLDTYFLRNNRQIKEVSRFFTELPPTDENICRYKGVIINSNDDFHYEHLIGVTAALFAQSLLVVYDMQKNGELLFEWPILKHHSVQYPRRTVTVLSILQLITIGALAVVQFNFYNSSMNYLGQMDFLDSNKDCLGSKNYPQQFDRYKIIADAAVTNTLVSAGLTSFISLVLVGLTIKIQI